MRDSGVVKTHELGDYWESKIDQSFICQVGDDKFFVDNGITALIQNHAGYRSRADIGYNPTTGRWFTWSVDFKRVQSFGINEIRDSDVKPRERQAFGFKGAMDRVIDIAASHTVARRS